MPSLITVYSLPPLCTGVFSPTMALENQTKARVKHLAEAGCCRGCGSLQGSEYNQLMSWSMKFDYPLFLRPHQCGYVLPFKIPVWVLSSVPPAAVNTAIWLCIAYYNLSLDLCHKPLNFTDSPVHILWNRVRGWQDGSLVFFSSVTFFFFFPRVMFPFSRINKQNYAFSVFIPYTDWIYQTVSYKEK